MTVTSTTAAPVTTTATGTSADAMSQLSGNFDTFLTLLTTQLKNQDPTSPMDSNAFTQQLVEFSQVEQQINTNTNLQTLIGQGTSAAGSTATTYLGHTVTVTNGQASLAQGSATWNYVLGNAAAATNLSVTDANGKVVYSGPGETGVGAHAFTWNGQDNNGNNQSDGTYTLAVTSQASDGSNVSSTISSTGVVSEIDLSGATPQLKVGNMSIGVGQVALIQ